MSAGLPGPDRVEVLAIRGVAASHVDRRREQLRVEPQRRLELRQGGGHVATRVVRHAAQEGRAGVVLPALAEPVHHGLGPALPRLHDRGGDPGGHRARDELAEPVHEVAQRFPRQQLGPVEGPRLDEQAGERGARRRRSRPGAERPGTAESRPPRASPRATPPPGRCSRPGEEAPAAISIRATRVPSLPGARPPPEPAAGRDPLPTPRARSRPSLVRDGRDRGRPAPGARRGHHPQARDPRPGGRRPRPTKAPGRDPRSRARPR